MKQLHQFPIDLLQVKNARIANLRNCKFSLILTFDEITLSDTTPNGDWATSKKNFILELDGITIPNISGDSGLLDLHDLSGRQLHLPINPDAGYVESAIYLSCAHNPVDLVAIRFRDVVGNSIQLLAKLRFNMEFECSGYRNFEAEVRCNATIG